MNVHTFVQEFNEKFPHIERFDDATPELIAKYEKELGFPLPKSFVEFLMNFPKGIQLLRCEPIGGVGEDCYCGDICKPSTILPDIPDEVLIVETNEKILSNNLISFTTYDCGNVSNDHWIFLCEEGILDNEYRVGYISQTKPRILKVLTNFEEWLTILWEQNDKDGGQTYPVYHLLFPSYDERGHKELYEGLEDEYN